MNLVDGVVLPFLKKHRIRLPRTPHFSAPRRTLSIALSWIVATSTSKSCLLLLVVGGQRPVIASFQQTLALFNGSHVEWNQCRSSSSIFHSTSISNNDSCGTMKASWQDAREHALQKVILPLSPDSHKGSSGRVAILGGSPRYTGAPYYAAMASLKAGADLAYVLTAQEAALPIKCYSPELMVAPVYTAAKMDELVQSNQQESPQADKLVQDMVQQVTAAMERLHCMVIGPGLGRCPLVFRAVAQIIQVAKKQGLYLVFDADSLYMLAQPEYKHLLQGYSKAILTPNAVEYKRLFPEEEKEESLKNFESVIILKKGAEDEIFVVGDTAAAPGAASQQWTCTEPGGLKRSGGIGDILSGTVGTLAAWHSILQQRGEACESDLPLACWTACCFVKRSTRVAFQSHGRSMTAPDVLAELGPTMNSMIENCSAKL